MPLYQMHRHTIDINNDVDIVNVYTAKSITDPVKIAGLQCIYEDARDADAAHRAGCPVSLVTRIERAVERLIEDRPVFNHRLRAELGAETSLFSVSHPADGKVRIDIHRLDVKPRLPRRQLLSGALVRKERDTDKDIAIVMDGEIWVWLREQLGANGWYSKRLHQLLNGIIANEHGDADRMILDEIIEQYSDRQLNGGKRKAAQKAAALRMQ